MSKKNAIRKLKEFHRWQRIANSLDLTYTELYQFDIEYHPTRRKHLEISRECALEELDAIRYAINQLSKVEYRQILIECYLISEEKLNKTLWKNLTEVKAGIMNLRKEPCLSLWNFTETGR